MTNLGWVGVLVATIAVAGGAAGCSCSGGTSVAIDAGSDACVPQDNPQRGHACASSAECPAGYACQTAFGTSMTCEITCTAATASCVCPSGLSCETPTGHTTGICS